MRRPPPEHPRLQLAFIAALGAASLAALIALRPAFSGDFWARGDDLALMVAWAISVAASAWLFVVTGACVVALGFSCPSFAHRLAPVLPFGVRRLVEVAVVACVALPALPAVPAFAAGPSRAAPVVLADQPVVRAPEVRAPAPASTPALAEHHVVVRGDNLWLIARAALTLSSSTRPDDAEIERYWHAVMAENRSTLRSGDPSLIFPGEIVTLPPPSAAS